MKKYVVLLFINYCFSQAPTIEWQKCLGGTNTDIPYGLVQTADGEFVVAGLTFSNNGDVPGNHSNIEDVWVVKLDSNGNVLWSKNYGGSGDDEALSLVESSDGGYVFAGYAKSNNGDVIGNHGLGNSDFWVVKINHLGNILWSKCLGGSGSDTAHDIIKTTDNGYVIIGQSNSNNFDVTGNHGLDDIWVVKLSANGVIEWQKSYGGSNHDLGQSISSTSDGGYIFTGMTRSNDGDVVGGNVNSNNMYNWVVKVDNSGTIQWQKIISTGWGYKILQLPNGEYIGLSSYGGIGLFKLNANGDILWLTSLGGSGLEYPGDLIINGDNFIITGRTNSIDGNISGNNGGFDAWIVQTDFLGNILWEKNFGGSSTDSITNIQQTTDSGFICAGYTSSNDGDVTGLNGSADFWVVKLSPEQLSNSSFLLDSMSIFPIPATTQINVKFSSKTTIEKILITDPTGKIIVNQLGSTNLINIESLSTGMYIIKTYSSDGQQYQAKFLKK